MKQAGIYSAVAVVALAPLAGVGQQTLRHDREGWERTYTATLPATARLRINGHGPVTVNAGASPSLIYTVKLSVRTSSETEARRILDRAMVRTETQGDTLVLTAPGGAVMARLTVKAPRLAAVAVGTSDGAVEATGIDGTLDVNSRAGEIVTDRIRGKCTLVTGGGDVRIGSVDGPIECVTSAGSISLKLARGEARLETSGGDITADQVDGALVAHTAGGGVHVRTCGGAVVATTGGGEIVIERAGGTVTARNMAGPVEVGAAAGVHSESASGGVRLGRISGPMRVSTSIGNIMADLMGARLANSFLATANGDITVLIPSNLKVTIQAENSMADSIRRIVSDFPAVAPRRQGTRVIARGMLNGGGPVLQIADTGGTIFIRKQ